MDERLNDHLIEGLINPSSEHEVRREEAAGAECGNRQVDIVHLSSEQGSSAAIAVATGLFSPFVSLGTEPSGVLQLDQLMQTMGGQLGDKVLPSVLTSRSDARAEAPESVSSMVRLVEVDLEPGKLASPPLERLAFHARILRPGYVGAEASVARRQLGRRHVASRRRCDLEDMKGLP